MVKHVATPLEILRALIFTHGVAAVVRWQLTNEERSDGG